MSNTGNVDFTDIEVPVTGGNGGTQAVSNCKVNNEGAAADGITGALNVGTSLVCTLTYTPVQEDLEVGEITLSGIGSSGRGAAVTPATKTTPASQDVTASIVTIDIAITGGKTKYNAVGKYLVTCCCAYATLLSVKSLHNGLSRIATQSTCSM